MKTFVLKLITFIVVGFFILNIAAWKFLSTENFLARQFSWHKVNRSVIDSKTADPLTDTLILGDSTCNQLFSAPYDGGHLVLAANVGVRMIGHYILAANVFERSDKIKNIVLISTPQFIGSRFESTPILSQFIKPFLRISHLKHISPLAHDKLRKRILSYLYIFPAFKVLSFDDIDFNDKKNKQYILSDMAVEYLQKLKNLADENGASLYIIAPPVLEGMTEKTNNFEIIKAKIEDVGLEGVFEDYFENIMLLEEKYFYDGIHLRREFISEYRELYLKQIYSITKTSSLPVTSPERPQIRQRASK